MATSQEELISRLWDDSEFWPHILSDEAFWERLEGMPPEQRADALSARVLEEQSRHADDVKAIRLLRAEQTGLVLALIEMIGVNETRRRLRPSTY